MAISHKKGSRQHSSSTTPPYYAIKVEGGALGTNGGPKMMLIVGCSRHGGVINGLYAAGNAMAAPTGMVYGGAGGTIEPAMTFY